MHEQRNSRGRGYPRFCFLTMGFRLRYEAVATALLRYLTAGVYRNTHERECVRIGRNIGLQIISGNLAEIIDPARVI